MVTVGIDRIEEAPYRALLKNQRIGLVTNASGLSPRYCWRGTVEVMASRYRVTALFAPEHGVRGVLGPGEKVSHGVDALSGLPTYSLFEDMVFAGADEAATDKAYMPAAESLREMDLLFFDMQDVGSRYFTYASTLFYTMRAAVSAGLPLVVADRPNPLGGEVVEGCRQDDTCRSFIGLTRVPIRHGLTLGELARYYNGAYGLGCNLTVIPMEGWERSMLWQDCGLPFVRPSPNLPTPASILVYNGTCMLAGTNATEGRGTTTPFTTVGAPYVNPLELTDALDSLRLEGLRFSPTHFIPAFSKYQGEVCRGVDIHITDPRAILSVRMGLNLILTLQAMYPRNFAFREPATPDGRWHIDLSTGNDTLRTTDIPAEDIYKAWQTDAVAFQSETLSYRLY
ncbi:MAG: DUF1343 domain-containing protein [Clostridia bacterium]|nr:DUF1343 domain-containing protein [Clostridia bacterium]